MQSISILNKKNRSKKIKDLYQERSGINIHDNPNIFFNPSKLLSSIGIGDILNEEPINSIKTAGRIWEFYLLRMVSVDKITYKKLIAPIPEDALPIRKANGISYLKVKLGNPYNQWILNYGQINDQLLLKLVKPFLHELIENRIPIRQMPVKRIAYFNNYRRNAAEAFFNHLLQNKIKKYQFIELRSKEYRDEKLTYLIQKFPKDNQFVAAGLMMCLYGGKNVDFVSGKLAGIVADSLKLNCIGINKSDTSELVKKLKQISKKKIFEPPFKDIYALGNRDRVNINFRIFTWLKLLNDTSECL